MFKPIGNDRHSQIRKAHAITPAKLISNYRAMLLLGKEHMRKLQKRAARGGFDKLIGDNM